MFERSRTMTFPEAQEWEVAMLHDLSYNTSAEWVHKALAAFRERKYRPAETSFLAPKDRGDE